MRVQLESNSLYGAPKISNKHFPDSEMYMTSIFQRMRVPQQVPDTRAATRNEVRCQAGTRLENIK